MGACTCVRACVKVRVNSGGSSSASQGRSVTLELADWPEWLPISDLELADWPEWLPSTGPRAPPVSVFSSAEVTGVCRQAWLYKESVSARDQTQVPVLARQALRPLSPLPGPRFSFYFLVFLKQGFFV